MALSSALLQGEGDDRHAIGCASRLRLLIKRNQSTTEREALTVVCSFDFGGYGGLIKKIYILSLYIDGHANTVKPDHKKLFH